MHCRHCQTELCTEVIDLGVMPPSNAYLTHDQLAKPERRFPLRVLVCEHCWLVQTEDFANRELLFDHEYAYFSGYSSTWLEHCKAFVQSAVSRFGLNSQSLVVEVAANDGSLLQYVQSCGIPCLGIEPTAATAAAARAKGVQIIEEFFGTELADRLAGNGKQADLMAANNVLAHVPNINDFVLGFARLLKPQGVASFEFPHLLQLVEKKQFDTIYHEHFSYLSLSAVVTIFESQGLSVFDVQELPTHGGSLRVLAQPITTGLHHKESTVKTMLDREQRVGICSTDFYRRFQKDAELIRDQLRAFLINASAEGKSVAAYGAAAKGNTLLNYASVDAKLISFVVDKNPAKQHKFLPGSHIPIEIPEHLTLLKPDYVLILPWNLADEVMAEQRVISEWGGRFLVSIPELRIMS